MFFDLYFFCRANHARSLFGCRLECLISGARACVYVLVADGCFFGTRWRWRLCFGWQNLHDVLDYSPIPPPTLLSLALQVLGRTGSRGAVTQVRIEFLDDNTRQVRQIQSGCVAGGRWLVGWLAALASVG